MDVNPKARDSAALRAGVWYTIGNFVNKGLIFLTTPVFARIMTKSDYGSYTNFTTWQALLTILVTLELYTSVNNARFEFKDEMYRYMSSILLAGSACTTICFLVTFLFRDYFCNLFNLDYQYVVIMFTYLLVAPALNIFQVYNRVNLRYKLAISLTLLSSCAAILLSLLLTEISSNQMFGRIIGYELPLIAVNLSIYLYLIYKGRALGKKYIVFAITYSAPLILHLLSLNILGSSDRIMITKMRGSEETALYSVAYSCALIVSVLMDSVNQAMSPWLYDNMKTEKYIRIKRINKLYIVSFCYIVIGIFLVAPEILLIMGGKSYLDAIYVIPPVIAGCCARFLYTNYVNIELYLKKSVLVSIGTVLAALTNIVLNIIFIPRFGYIAAAYTTFFSYICLLFFHFTAVHKLGYSFVYSNKLLFSLLLVIVIISFGCIFLYKHNTLRLCFLFMYFIILIAAVAKEKEMILMMVRAFVKK